MEGYENGKLNVMLTLVPDNFRLECCFGGDIVLPFILVVTGVKSLNDNDLELSM